MNSPTSHNRALILGLAGVCAFSLTLPFTRHAVSALDPLFVAFARALAAAIPAGAWLLLSRARIPALPEFGRIAIVAAGVVVGFPALSALAMRGLDASHGAVMLGILPLATASAGALISRERPSAPFWLAALAGSGLVVAFAVSGHVRSFAPGDWALMGAVAAAAIGYAMGARLSSAMSGIDVISWALVIAAPILAIPTWRLAPATLDQPRSVWCAFTYLSLVSQFLGFIPWYRALALGGTARVGQVQLLQPFLTLAAAAGLLGEAVDTRAIVYAVLVLIVVMAGRRAAVARPSEHPAAPPLAASGARSGCTIRRRSAARGPR